MVFPILIFSIHVSFGVVLLLSRSRKSSTSSISTPAVLGLSFLLSILMLFFSNEDAACTVSVYSSAQSGLNISLLFFKSRLECLLIAFFTFIWLMMSVFHSRNSASNQKYVNAAYCFSLALIIGLILSGNILTIFILSFLGGLAACFMLSLEQKKLSFLKALIVSFIGDAALFAVVIISWKVSGSFSAEDIKKSIDAGFFSGPLLTANCTLLLVAVAAKANLFPFHFVHFGNEQNSIKQGSLIQFAALSSIGIIILLKLSVIIPADFLSALVLIAILGTLFFLILAGFSTDLNTSVRYIIISQYGLAISAIAIGCTGPAILIFVYAVISGLAFEFTTEMAADRKKTNELFYWIYLASALVFSAVPLTSGFIAYGTLFNSVLSLNLMVESFRIPILIIICLAIFSGSFNIFRFFFKSNSLDYELISKPKASELYNHIPAAILILFSLFFIYSINPLDFSTSWLLQFAVLKNQNSPLELYSLNGFLSLIFVMISSGIGAVLGYFNSRNVTEMTNVNIRSFWFERTIDNMFAEILIPAQTEIPDKRKITLSKLLGRVFTVKELSTYAAYSLFILVLFYVIFRNL